jgi:uncharacterized membrane protein YgcG
MRIASSGKVLINTTATSTGQVNIVGSAAGVSSVGGIYQETLINPSVSGNFQFGNRHIINVAPSASSSMDGQFVRMIDNTSLNNTVRAMEVQAWSGTNIQGINTGLFAAGRTFGVQAISNGTAGGIAAPAALFGEIQSADQGQGLRLYSQNIASSTQDLAQFFQEISTFQGTGLKMDFARTGGTFTGNYLNFLRNSTSVFAVNATGSVMIGTSTPYNVANLVVCAQSNCTLPASTSTVAVFGSTDGTTATRSIIARGTITGQLSDIGEYVPVAEGSYEAGDILSVISGTSSAPSALFAKSSGTYDPFIAGVVTDASAFIAGGEISGNANVKLMALAGRVPVKVTGENGPIVPGDLITAASKEGKGMKAVKRGRMVGIALGSFAGTTAEDEGTVLLFINPHWAYPPASEVLQGGESGTMEMNAFTLDEASSSLTIATIKAGKIEVKELTVGSAEQPTGITMFDVKTGQPYCLVIEEGAPKSYPGKCADQVFTVPLPPADTASSTPEEASSTPDTASSTPDVPPADDPAPDTASSTPEEPPPSDTASSTPESTSPTDTPPPAEPPPTEPTPEPPPPDPEPAPEPPLPPPPPPPSTETIPSTSSGGGSSEGGAPPGDVSQGGGDPGGGGGVAAP